MRLASYMTDTSALAAYRMSDWPWSMCCTGVHSVSLSICNIYTLFRGRGIRGRGKSCDGDACAAQYSWTGTLRFARRTAGVAQDYEPHAVTRVPTRVSPLEWRRFGQQRCVYFDTVHLQSAATSLRKERES